MLSGKRLLLLGVILLLLIATPATVYFLQQQQNTQSQAKASTTLAFYADNNLTKIINQTNPLTKNVGDTFPVVIAMDPGENLVASTFLYIKYDPAKLEVVTSAPSGAAEGTTGGFVRNTVVFLPEPIEGPKYSNGEIAVWITTGTAVATAIQAPDKPRVGTVTFRAIAATGSTPTQVSFGPDTQVNAWGGNATLGENVLLPSSPAYIVINGGTPQAPTNTPTPTTTPGGVIATATPAPVFATATPVEFATPTPTLAETGPGDIMMGMGAIAGLMMIVGAFLFFVL